MKMLSRSPTLIGVDAHPDFDRQSPLRRLREGAASMPGRLLGRALAAATLLMTSAFAAQSTEPRAGDDFYRFVNNAWLGDTPIPAGRSSFDTGALLRQRRDARIASLISGAANGDMPDARPGEHALIRLIGDYYASEADAVGIEHAGLAPLAAELRAINEIKDRHTLAVVLGRSVRLDDGTNTVTEGLFGIWIHQGFQDPDHYAVHLVQGGLGLSDRDDYLNDAADKAALRTHYLRHVTSLLSLAHVPDAGKHAGRVLALEVAIARTHASRADTDDVFKTDNGWTRGDFMTRAPGLDWTAFFSAAGLVRPVKFIVWQPTAIVGAATLVASQPLEAWKDYLTAHVIEHYAPVLPNAFATEHDALVHGLAEPAASLDRKQLAIATTNAALGDAVGRLYVARYFPPTSKAAAAAMVENLRSAFRARLLGISWASSQTKGKMLAKLAALHVGLGYPNRWTDYRGLTFTRGQALANRRRLERFEYQRQIDKLSQPVDPEEWSALAPQSVNAIINFYPNALQFAAALLEPPFFDPAADAASNYGSAGAGISHEIWHSFDELGHIYGADGRLGDWWTAQDAANFRAATSPLALQYAGYCPAPQLCVRTEQILVESTADLVGLSIAHDAYRLSLNGQTDSVQGGLTGEQRFFRAYAQRWRRVQTDDAVRQAIATDTHAPPELRAATVRNLDAWYEAFSVAPGDRLYLKPEERVRLP
jgi:putative endopeptidase